MKAIPLTQGKMATVSNLDYRRLSKFKWHAHKDNRSGRWYAARAVRRADGKVIISLMHREVRNPKLGFEIDHKDRNGLNNCRSNLRDCTHRQNNMNQGVNNTLKKSAYKGVSQNGKNWQARILGKYLGTVKNEIEAAKLYDKAAKKLFGKYAHLNFPKRNTT